MTTPGPLQVLMRLYSLTRFLPSQKGDKQNRRRAEKRRNRHNALRNRSWREDNKGQLCQVPWCWNSPARRRDHLQFETGKESLNAQERRLRRVRERTSKGSAFQGEIVQRLYSPMLKKGGLPCVNGDIQYEGGPKSNKEKCITARCRTWYAKIVYNSKFSSRLNN